MKYINKDKGPIIPNCKIKPHKYAALELIQAYRRGRLRREETLTFTLSYYSSQRQHHRVHLKHQNLFLFVNEIQGAAESRFVCGALAERKDKRSRERSRRGRRHVTIRNMRTSSRH